MERTTNSVQVKIIAFIILQIIFVYLEFGLLFFIIAVFYWIFTNTSGPVNATVNGQQGQSVVARKSKKKLDAHLKRKEEEAMQNMSAYSVFNKNGQRLAGQLTAEHFEKQIYGR